MPKGKKTFRIIQGTLATTKCRVVALGIAGGVTVKLLEDRGAYRKGDRVNVKQWELVEVPNA